MSAEHERLKEILAEAAALATPEGRRSYLDAACGDDADLRTKVDGLLKAHERAGDFLEEPVFPSADEPIGEGPGSVIDHYKLLEQVGEGGMGVVYRAEQGEPVRREVALKVIKMGMDTREVVARFETERQALALMDHPHIAHMFDAGTTDSGRPYFVMELVKGIPITEYCDRNKLQVRERLDLFHQVCEAIQHAHQKGIIHRDIKPSNVLVTLQDGIPFPKVIDFGVAKATQQRLTEKTMFTRSGQMIGTPEYMSPEQAENGGLDVDTRSDVYSLGVLLYELLTGSPPFESAKLREAGMNEVCRIIRDVDPPKPSTRISTLGAGLLMVAARRSTGPKKLGGLVRGELDWVVMKTLEKDRTRRYETVSALGADIRHYLSGEPVEAGPPTAFYRLSKLARRHKRALAAVALVFVTLVAGVITTSWQAVRATHAEKQAEEARSQAVERATIARNRMLLMGAQGLAGTKPQEALLILRELSAKVRPETAKLALDISHEALRRSLFVTECRLLGRHSSSVVQTAWSPDGRQLLTRSFGSRDNSTRIWNVDGGGETLVLPANVGGGYAAWSPDSTRIVTVNFTLGLQVWNADGSGDPVVLDGPATAETGANYAAWSPDGKRIVTASADWTARVWNADGSGEPVVLSGHTRQVSRASWSPDGKRILTASADKTVRVWNTNGSGSPMVLGHGGRLVSAEWSPDGRQILTAAAFDGWRVWDADGKPEPVLRGGDASGRGAAWSPDGKRFVTTGGDRTTRVWNADVRGKPIVLDGSEKFLAWSPDSKSIITSSGDQTARVWRIDGPASVIPLAGHDEKVLDAAWSPDGKRIVTGSDDGTARVWSMNHALDSVPLIGHRDVLLDAQWSLDGERIVTASRDGTARIWDADGSDAAIELVGEGDRSRQAMWSPDGKRIVTLSAPRGSAQLWNSDGRGEPVVLAEGARIPCWSPDGKCIAMTIAPTNPVRVWNADGSVTPIALPHPAGVLSIAWSPDGNRIATACFDGAARVWNADGTGAPILLVGRLVGHNGVKSATWSPDGKRIVTASMEATALVWNADGTGTPTILAGHQAEVNHAVWSPDGKRIVTASKDTTARVWNVDGSGTPIVLTGHTESVDRAAWTPDGDSIVTASKDGTIRLWSAHGKGEELVFATYFGVGASAYIALSPDGNRIVTASRDGTAWVRTIRDWPETRTLLWEQLPDILTPDERTLYLGETGEEDSDQPDQTASLNESLANYELALQRGWEATRNQRWPEAAKAYAEALGNPDFQLQTFTSKRQSYRVWRGPMAIAFVRAGDHSGYEKFCRLRLSADPDHPSVGLARQCFLDGGNLPAELQQRALKLGRVAVVQWQGKLRACQSAGIAEYHAGDPEKAVELLERAEGHPDIGCRGAAMVYRAMALKKLGRNAKATELLGRAETLLAEPLKNRTEKDWFDLEICQIALEQARRVVGSSVAR